MASNSTQRVDFAKIWRELARDGDVLLHPVDATYVAGSGGLGDEREALPRLALAGEGNIHPNPELELAGIIAEGGMGEVHAALQMALRRVVAIKCTKPGAGANATQELLREARVTGSLEHPNIVPVYSLGQDAQGRPILVMKRVDGVAWSTILREEGPPRTRAQLERHLEIFGQVCNAVEFAHSRAVIHRDLKPDNVMIGAFGEVYVLDWGLAVSLEGDPARGIPIASSENSLAGTPAYMAPEMVQLQGALLGRHTDIYLLGAVLHEVLTGLPPHQGTAVLEVLQSAYASAPPTFDPDVPEELAAICRRAMAKEPEERFPSVTALREAVRDFLHHRGSVQLTSETMKRLEALEGGSVPDIRATLEQCQFGFEQALRSWPENAVARDGLRRSLERALAYAAADGDLRAAERLLAKLGDPRPEQVAAVEELRRHVRASEAEVRRLHALQRDLDVEVSSRTRNAFLVIISIVWAAVPLALGWLERASGSRIGGKAYFLCAFVFAATVGLGVLMAKGQLTRNRANRRILGALVICAVSSVLVRAIALQMALSVDQGLTFELLAYGLVAAMVANAVDRRFAWTAAVYFLAALIRPFVPQFPFEVAGVANLLALTPPALFWERLGQTAPHSPPE